MDPECRLRTGERAYFVRGGLLFPDGRFVAAAEPCVYEQGSIWTFNYDESPAEDDMEPGTPTPAEPSVAPVPPAPAVPAPVVPPAPPPEAAPEPVHHEPVHHESASVVPSDSADLSQVLNVGQYLQDNPWAPLVLVVLAVVAVLGGRQGWKFYSERAAQKHELAMKELEIKAEAAKTPSVQPAPCHLKDTAQDAQISGISTRLDELTARVRALEEKDRGGNPLGDFDPQEIAEHVEDIEKRLKKLEKKPATSTRKPTTSA